MHEQLRLEKEITGFYISGHPLDDYRLVISNFCNVTLETLKADLKRFKGNEISFAGMLTGVQHRTGKNGKPYGSFMVEDYTDSMTLFLYSEDYLKYRHLLEDGFNLFVKARVEARFDAPDQLVVRVNTLSLLSEVLERFARGISVTVPVEDFTEELAAALPELARKHKGKCALRIRIEDRDGKMHVELPSKKFRVNPSEIVAGLAEYPSLEVRIIHD
jgi:DNA polymerase-3 subunit alpha